MTKEELEKEAEDFLQKKWGTSEMLILGGDAKEVLADSAEPREKQIEIDAEQIRALQKQNGELTDKVNDLEEKLANADYQLEGRDNEIRELKEQIQKMKCCENCKHAWCRTSSSSNDKEGKRIFHKWNNTKRKYCDVGKNGKYQCWELAD